MRYIFKSIKIKILVVLGGLLGFSVAMMALSLLSAEIGQTVLTDVYVGIGFLAFLFFVSIAMFGNSKTKRQTRPKW